MGPDNQLALGTAKLGIPSYGYSNGFFLADPVEFIIKALDRGIRCIDTAPRYGNSEELIGQALRLTEKKVSISTKVDNLVPGSGRTPGLMVRSIEKSISKLNTTIDLCYLHQSDMKIISDKHVHEGIAALKNSHLVKEVGTSVYTKEELIYSLDCGVFDWVQIPVNILDTSFYRIASKHSAQCKIAARSVFLQGVIFDDERVRKNIKQSWALMDFLSELRVLCSEFGVSIQELSIAYLASLSKINQIIVGTISDEKLRENISSMNLRLDSALIELIEVISSEPKSWSDPRSWSV